MAGNLNVPNTFATQSGNVPASQLDDNNSSIETYVNAREVAIGLVAARPAAGVAGRWFFATDVAGGTLYVDNGSTWTAVAAPASVTTTTSQVFLSGSAATYTTPANVRYIEIEMVGGGGGGGGGNNPGAPGTGGDGTGSTFSGGTLSAGGGTAGGSAAFGPGGTASGGNILNLSGEDGRNVTPISQATGGDGGGSFFGGSGLGGQAGGGSAGGAGKTNTGAGGGGGGIGAVSNAGAGGGAAGYVRHRITSPASTYTYTVGAGGAGGAAGASAAAGGAGAAGLIIVTEFYI